jgi:diadenosine tetraphosphate (Ap4A) HIT family hydrolase
VPKYHAEKLHQLPKEYMADVGSLMVDVAKALQAENYNVVQNNGMRPGGGQGNVGKLG